jgi:hypothetical protein
MNEDIENIPVINNKADHRFEIRIGDTLAPVLTISNVT